MVRNYVDEYELQYSSSVGLNHARGRTKICQQKNLTQTL